MRPAIASGPSSNRILNYQLRLTSNIGVPVADGTKNVKLTFFTAASGGTQLYTACSANGTATGTPTAVVATFASGQSSILIGSTLTCASGSSPAIPATLFDNTSIFLGVTIESDAEMTPRKRIVAAGYALNADKLDDLETSSTGGANAFVPVTDTSGNFTLSGNVTVDATTFFVDAANNRVGVGTASPSVPLEVRNANVGILVDNNANAFSSIDIDSGGSAEDFSVIRLLDRGTNKWEIRKRSDGAFDVRDATAATAPFAIEDNTGTDTLYLDSTGNVGIGIANPASFKLQVAGSAGPNADDTFDLGSNTLRWRDLYLGPATLHIGTATGDEGTMTYNTATNVLGIDSTGTVDINGGSGSTGCSVDASGNFACTGTVTGSGSGNAFVNGGNSFAATATLGTNDANSLSFETNNVTYLTIASGGGFTLPVDTNWALTGGVNGLSFDGTTFSVDATNDRVGIGTAAPTYKLDVASGTNGLRINSTAGNITDVNALVIENAGGADYMKIRNTGSGTGGAELILDGATSGIGKGAWLSFQNSGNDNWTIGQDIGAAGDLGFSIVSGTQLTTNTKFYITQAGNVGIGDTSPAATLTVGNGDLFQVAGATGNVTTSGDFAVNGGDVTTSSATFNVAASATTVNIAGGSGSTGCTVDGSGNLACTGTVSGSGGLSGSGAAGQATFWTGTSTVAGDNAFFWDNTNKRLGVGTTTPSSPLDVTFAQSSTGGMEFASSLKITNTDATANNWANVIFSDGTNGRSATISAQFTDHTNGSKDADLMFATVENNALGEKMRILNNGNVGIATATPTGARLQVAGAASTPAVRLTGADYSNALELDNASQSWRFTVWSDNDLLLVKSSGSTFTPFRVQDDGFDDELVLGANGVGIGTSSPNDRLEVVGSGTAIRATDGSVVTRLFSSSSTGAGYVGTNSANNFVLRTGAVDRLTIDTTGNILPAGTGQSIIFPAQTGDNTAGELIMFNGCCSNGRRAIIGHSPSFPDWGLSYDDTNDDFYFATGLTATPDLAINMGSAQIYVGTAVSGTGTAVYRATTGQLSGSQANGVQFDGFAAAGVLMEDAGSEGGGFFANGNTAAIWSPGDSNGVVSVYDEDFFSGGTPPTPDFRVQSGGMGSFRSLAGGGTTLCYNTSTFSGVNTLSNCVSSRKYKENITPLAVDVDRILELQPVRFAWKKIHHDAVTRGGKVESPAYDEQLTGPDIGLIAEDAASIVPDIITYDASGQVNGIEYKLLTVYELAVLKKHEADIAALKQGTSIGQGGTMTVNEIDADLVKARSLVIRNAGANKTAGTGTIPPGTVAFTVQNINSDAKSLIGVTFKDDPGARWWIGQQSAGTFTLNLSAPAPAALRFTYWIVGVEDGISP